nr:hypothetical protein Iba_chr09bCG13490 [Ipomoea batatas]GME03658.1 hypothetical protein Iba_scaffold1011.2CG0180 [Ipomoea batatas]
MQQALCFSLRRVLILSLYLGTELFFFMGLQEQARHLCVKHWHTNFQFNLTLDIRNAN